jgi:hypothetical protein
VSITNRHAGKYSAGDGLELPAEGFTGTPDVPCPDVGDRARSWWATWATSEYAHAFRQTEWQDLSDCALIMDKFFESGEPRHMAEARQHMAGLFGLATRARLHVRVAAPAEPVVSPIRRERRDPRVA